MDEFERFDKEFLMDEEEVPVDKDLEDDEDEDGDDLGLDLGAEEEETL